MPRHLPAFVAFLSLVDVGTEALAQRPPEAMTRQVSAVGAGIQGVVRDEAGQGLGGVSILAMGATLAVVRTDSRGQFLLLLAPGEYILRVVRDGYLSTVREAIRVHPAVPIERDITLMRLASDTQPARGPAPADAVALPVADDSDHAHTELAWRLRHMTRSVLRDAAAVPVAVERDDAGLRRGFGGRLSVIDWAVEGSARAATSFFGDTDFRGQVNFLTMSTLSGDTGETPLAWPRGAAYVVVGAPVGSHGDWSVHAAMVPDDLASWTLLGEYETHADRVHAFRLGVSYSTQASVTALAALPSIAAPGSRRVGGVYGFDTWRARPDVTLEYGLRIDRYDYLAETNLVSPRIGARVALFPGATVIAETSRRLIAPGADEFLPPSTRGPWLPPQRTFSTLAPDAPLHPEEVQRYELGLEYELAGPGSSTVGFRRVTESTRNQVATLFGLDSESEVGHYYVASSGSVDLEGWMMGVGGDLGPHMRGTLDYTVGRARWREAPPVGTLSRPMPPGARPVAGRVHDLTASLDGRIPGTATRLAVVYRFNTDLLRGDRRDRPAVGGRFNVEVRQELPYQPIQGGTLDLVFAVRTLLSASADRGSFYDELLTVAPPMRLVCGVQVGF